MRLFILSFSIFLFTISFKELNCNQNERFKGVNLELVPKVYGQPWPMPQIYTSLKQQRNIDSKYFKFSYSSYSVVCDLLTNAFYRYYKIIFRPEEYEIIPNRKVVKRRPIKFEKNNDANLSNMHSLSFFIHQPCEEYPTMESDESYTLKISDNSDLIEAKTVWGALRGLETFAQLVVENSDGSFTVNDTYIMDYPRFHHRGLLLDTSRHFVSVNILKINLEAMAANKMNVFHWHIVDDQSFPFQSKIYPDLSDKGAYDPYTHVYSTYDVKDVIEFARQRGIRVLVEFDTPGHTLSWGKAVPILTPCYSGNQPNGQFGPIDPSNNLTFEFMRGLLKEVISVFPDKYVHLGGDEVDFSCWKSNSQVNSFMKEMGFGEDYSKLEEFYEQKLLNIVNEISPETGYIVWQEVVDNGVKVKDDTVVQVWKSPYPDELDKVTKLGYRALLSTCWYLDWIQINPDWPDYYHCDPFNFNGTEEQKKLVLGGEACLWGEFVDGVNVISRAWPRASAVAERLWSDQSVNSTTEALPRLDAQRCRMLRRGIPTQPTNGPGYCDYEIQS